MHSWFQSVRWDRSPSGPSRARGGVRLRRMERFPPRRQQRYLSGMADAFLIDALAPVIWAVASCHLGTDSIGSSELCV
ncbi:hypothetical protein DPEC_G00359180 [Dallia pectoralis]|uniref:Uncharacterized protein n=1 Tax=Dallia pectoralis TaxID=75939 RepID=A0ACC2F0L1_DALPE|nr:hypothetical protein DPEC_G00359180 [Dallia pectoralis]